MDKRRTQSATKLSIRQVCISNSFPICTTSKVAHIAEDPYTILVLLLNLFVSKIYMREYQCWREHVDNDLYAMYDTPIIFVDLSCQ